METNCKTEGCKRRAFRIDRNRSGEPVAVFQTRHDSKAHLQEFTAEELERIIKDLRLSKAANAG